MSKTAKKPVKKKRTPPSKGPARPQLGRELAGLLCLFVVLFTLISLLSYSPADPSIHHVGAGADIHNLFGLVGAQVSGLLIGLFGLGAFWFPLLILFVSIHLFTGGDRSRLARLLFGGTLLIVGTGSFFAFFASHYPLFGEQVSAGGLVGLPLKTALIRYSNFVGGVIIVLLIWLVGFILATGFSLLAFARASGRLLTRMGQAVWAQAAKQYQQWKSQRRDRRYQVRPPGKVAKEKGGFSPADGDPGDRFFADASLDSLDAKAPPEKPSRSAKRPEPPEPSEKKPKESGAKIRIFKPRLLTREAADPQPAGRPALELLADPEPRSGTDEQALKQRSQLLENKLEDFGVKGKIVAVMSGPVITTFEYEPASGVKINKIVNLADDIALALSALSVRIVAPIPGKSVIGIEIPNTRRELVRLKDVVNSPRFKNSDSLLTLALGKDMVGEPVVSDLDKMPHLLIAGATGTGKSVGLNAMICSLLYRARPQDIKFIMIDPKKIELSLYDGIPHLISPVVTDPRKATQALFWAVNEMERRYERLSAMKVRNIRRYNRKVEQMQADGEKKGLEKLPYLVLIIDELADLMMVSSKDVENALTRLAQMARAAGIHLILATQRPSVDVITGVIKANFPTRLSFQVSSRTDSRTILDTNGAEQLLGQGDMLFLPPGTATLQRIHGAYISEEEVSRITGFFKGQKQPEYDKSVLDSGPSDKNAEFDEKYDEAVAFVTKMGEASVSMVQRHLKIGYNRTLRILKKMESEGIIGPAEGLKPRKVLVRGYESASQS